MRILQKTFFLSAFLFIGGLFLVIIPKQVSAQSATLSFSPASGTYAKNQEFTIQIMCNSGSTEVDGVDTFIEYDPSVLQVVSSDANTQYFSNKTSEDKSSSVYWLYFELADPNSTGPTGSFAIGSITFRALQETSSTTIEYVTGSSDPTTNSVVASEGESLSLSTTPASYTISGTLPDSGIMPENSSIFLAAILLFTASGLILNILRLRLKDDNL